MTRGFTLIELSIVLVIIGLIIGGVLVGQDIIRAAEVRATISQIERYQTAVNTFRGKYAALPGDIKDPDASSFGFLARGSYAGEGDGNGVIEGNWNACNNCNAGTFENGGETLMFWVDLSTSKLIEGTFNSMTSMGQMPGPSAVLSEYFPAAKIGGGNYVYVHSAAQESVNYFGISAVTSVLQNPGMLSSPGLTVQQAYSIDKKMDDGLPQSGSVNAYYLNGIQNQYTITWAAGGGNQGASSSNLPTTSATTASSTTCYDNGGGTGPQQYSIELNGGAGVNCALSFQFQ